MEKELFEHRVKALYPKAKIHRTVSLNAENHLALVTINDGKPFFVGLKHGMPSPFDVRTVRAAIQHYKDSLDMLEGMMDYRTVLMVPHEQRDWTAFNALVGIEPKEPKNAQTD